MIPQLARAGRIAMLLMAASACAQVSPLTQGDLQILSKGAPTVTVFIDGVERMQVTCNGTGVVKPGGRMPSPPFALKVIRQNDGRVLLDERIAELPRWVLVTRESTGVSDAPISGPFVPCE